MTALDALGLNQQQAAEVKSVKVEELQEYIPAGIYPAIIKTFGTYTSEKGSLMGFAELELTVDDKTRSVRDYIFIPGDQSDEKDEKKKKKFSKIRENALAKINGYVEATEQKLEKLETQVIENDISKKFTNFIGIAERPVSCFLTVTHTEGGQYEWQNNVNNVFRPDGTNADGVDQKEVFLKNIEKRPINERKEKEASGGSGGTASKPSSSAAAKL